MDDRPPFAGRTALVIGALSVTAGVLLAAAALAVLAWGTGRL